MLPNLTFLRFSLLPGLIFNNCQSGLVRKACVRNTDFRFGLSKLCLGQINYPAQADFVPRLCQI
jgi:hypothetical protein